MLFIGAGSALVVSGELQAITVLGTGTAALIGGDLTDPENDGAADADSGYNAVFASSEEAGFGGGEFAFNIFDNRVGGGNDKWCCGNDPGFPYWVQATFEQPIQVTQFTLSSANDTPGRDPRVWQILGSNDGVNFDTIFSQDNPASSLWGDTRLQVIRFDAGADFTLPDYYSTIRLNVDATGLTTGARFQIAEFEIFGNPIPEPSVSTLLALCGFGALSWRRR